MANEYLQVYLLSDHFIESGLVFRSKEWVFKSVNIVIKVLGDCVLPAVVQSIIFASLQGVDY